MRELSDYLTLQGWKYDWDETKQRHPFISNSLDAIIAVYRKKDVNVNVNILAAAAPSIEAASRISGYLQQAKYGDDVISAAAAITDWAAFIPIHIALHYIANKDNFQNVEKTFDKNVFLKDTGHVYLTMLPSIGLFYLIATPLQYALLKLDVSADTANRLAYWGTMVGTRAVSTMIGYRTGLFTENKSDIV